MNLFPFKAPRPPQRGPLQCLLLCLAFLLLPWSAGAKERFYGVLQSSPERAEAGRKDGWNVAVVEVAWDAFAPTREKIDPIYVEKLRQEIKTLRGLGYRLQLDLGTQYPPAWIWNQKFPRYRNQFGADHQSSDPGKNIPNYVFNQALREDLAAYMAAVFRELGSNWDWVRLGGGFYGEVNYPSHRFAEKENCYWAFDDLAQGHALGLADGLKPCPVPGWIPGQAAKNGEASAFLEWYLGALQNFHNWQIQTLRRHYSGEICLLYGSWGLRPGQIETAVAGNLDGKSPAEKVGEIQGGFDWPRMIGGIKDEKAIVYCTWVDAPAKDCNDDGDDRLRWSPLHWQSSLATSHPLKLKVWGENTGRGTKEDLELSFSRMKRFNLIGLVWAFEKDLFIQPNPDHLATAADWAQAIRANP